VPVGITLACVLLILLCIAYGAVYYIKRNTLVSPLPGKLGGLLVTAASEPGEKGVIRHLNEQKITYTGVQTTNDGYIITLNPKQQVVLAKKKDISTQISSLQVILPRLTMEGREFRRLDLRFNKPVVTY
jgi:hypothetical protein